MADSLATWPVSISILRQQYIHTLFPCCSPSGYSLAGGYHNGQAVRGVKELLEPVVYSSSDDLVLLCHCQVFARLTSAASAILIA